MKISEYIEKLEEIKKEHGDIEVEKSSFGRRHTAQSPQLSNRLILKGRETSDRFWSEHSYSEDQKGEKVVQI